MMNRKEFYEYVKDNVKEYLPESYKDAEITLQEVEKNNGLKLTGITIPNGDQNRTESLSGFRLPGICDWKRCGFLCWRCG